MLSLGGFSAYRMAFELNPVDYYMQQDNNIDSQFAQSASISGQLVQQSKPRTAAREASLREIAKSKPRRLLTRNQSFGRADVGAGDSVPSCKLVSRRSALRRRGPAVVSEIMRRAPRRFAMGNFSRMRGIVCAASGSEGCGGSELESGFRSF